MQPFPEIGYWPWRGFPVADTTLNGLSMSSIAQSHDRLAISVLFHISCPYLMSFLRHCSLCQKPLTLSIHVYGALWHDHMTFNQTLLWEIWAVSENRVTLANSFRSDWILQKSIESFRSKKTTIIPQPGHRRYQTSPAVCNRSLNSIYFLNVSTINTELTSFSYVHESKYICFSVNVQSYYSNNGYGDVRFGNSSHNSSNLSVRYYFTLRVISK